ncbi:putative nuclear polyadenylated RNA-binding protein Nab2/ZC3H14 [Helianthus anomalus]
MILTGFEVRYTKRVRTSVKCSRMSTTQTQYSNIVFSPVCIQTRIQPSVNSTAPQVQNQILNVPDSADDLCFEIMFPRDGAKRLRDRVKEKLNEFIGNYNVDPVVEYVMRLLEHQRRKEEVSNDINTFLGDDKDSLVSWLWDHL